MGETMQERALELAQAVDSCVYSSNDSFAMDYDIAVTKVLDAFTRIYNDAIESAATKCECGMPGGGSPAGLSFDTGVLHGINWCVDAIRSLLLP